MVQVLVSLPDSPNQCPEWAIVDLQGSLETRQPVPLGGKFVGDLHFTKQNVPILIIGHHILYGKIVDMEKPFAVIVKDESSETATDRDTDKNTSVNYVVKALIKKKLLFKQRPKPIIANIPKKL
ncbi:chromosome transmission fidelity protein 8 homolog [Crassostrea angulata]|uniref:Chromosome transmission fidelity protein 8-like protein n=1 Tax=Magallana gigas TaxID=29159 RepID=A0A8W8K637_MAGGI|nr:chromosome transmission fidelity protein 8 homolog [Crassostrea gigas]XP_052715178.1 chromosome transmission fidelity protein 8 homolog [Crassostrea angulata]